MHLTISTNQKLDDASYTCLSCKKSYSCFQNTASLHFAGAVGFLSFITIRNWTMHLTHVYHAKNHKTDAENMNVCHSYSCFQNTASLHFAGAVGFLSFITIRNWTMHLTHVYHAKNHKTDAENMNVCHSYSCFQNTASLHFAGAVGFLSFNSSYISQRRLFCFASSCLISLFSSRRLIKDS